MVILDAHGEREPVFAEGAERERRLLAGLGDGHQVAGELEVLRLGLEHLDVAALGHLDEVLLLLERLLLLVVRHAKHAKTGFLGLVPLGEHYEPGTRIIEIIEIVNIATVQCWHNKDYLAMKGTTMASR